MMPRLCMQATPLYAVATALPMAVPVAVTENIRPPAIVSMPPAIFVSVWNKTMPKGSPEPET